MPSISASIRAFLALALLSVTGAAAPGAGAESVSGVVVSQIYGGGGSSSATYASDFLELHNTRAVAIDLSGWSVQYAPATGAHWRATAISGSIAPGGYYLVKESTGTTGAVLPAPDATGTLAMSASAGKVALVTSATPLTCSPSCPGATGRRRRRHGHATAEAGVHPRLAAPGDDRAHSDHVGRDRRFERGVQLLAGREDRRRPVHGRCASVRDRDAGHRLPRPRLDRVPIPRQRDRLRREPDADADARSRVHADGAPGDRFQDRVLGGLDSGGTRRRLRRLREVLDGGGRHRDAVRDGPRRRVGRPPGCDAGQGRCQPRRDDHRDGRPRVPLAARAPRRLGGERSGLGDPRAQADERRHRRSPADRRRRGARAEL
ncbi:MAG: hypothetical protein E6G67_03815, partial [Actinobacteria bacterium]